MIPALQVAENLGLVPVVDVRILDWHLEDEEFGRTVEGGERKPRRGDGGRSLQAELTVREAGLLWDWGR